jgi:DNA-binding MarR family transcriptional regulator
MTDVPDGLHHEANLVGALALAVTDRTSAAMAAASGVSESAATALSALHHFLQRPSIDVLRQVLGLTSSGTVRLVDKLVEAGYVRRSPGPDARSTAVTLTASGRAAAKRVASARAAVLNEVLAPLSQPERATLEDVLGKVLVGLMRPPGATRWNCRQCDTGLCRGRGNGCPVGNEAMRRYFPADAQDADGSSGGMAPPPEG